MLTYKTIFLKNNYFPKQKNEKSRTVLQSYKSIQYLAWEEILDSQIWFCIQSIMICGLGWSIRLVKKFIQVFL